VGRPRRRAARPGRATPVRFPAVTGHHVIRHAAAGGGFRISPGAESTCSSRVRPLSRRIGGRGWW
jgi:hypothetical protein